MVAMYSEDRQPDIEIAVLKVHTAAAAAAAHQAWCCVLPIKLDILLAKP